MGGFNLKNSEEVSQRATEGSPEDTCSDATFDSLITSVSVSGETEPTGTGVDAANLKTYPHNGCSGPLPRENTAAAPQPAPKTAEIPQDAHACPLSDFREADGTVTHFGGLNASGAISERLRAGQQKIRDEEERVNGELPEYIQQLGTR